MFRYGARDALEKGETDLFFDYDMPRNNIRYWIQGVHIPCLYTEIQ